MTDTPTAPAKPKRKYTRTKKAEAAPKPASRPASELAGITAIDCPKACNAERCVISGGFYCGHPYKGGLQGRDMSDDAKMQRVADAKKLLGKKKIAVAANA